MTPRPGTVPTVWLTKWLRPERHSTADAILALGLKRVELNTVKVAYQPLQSQQAETLAEVFDQRVGRRSTWSIWNFERLSDGLPNQLRIGQRRKLDQPYAIDVGIRDLRGNPQRQPSFATAARAGQCEQAR
jgi:hypothetical protein